MAKKTVIAPGIEWWLGDCQEVMAAMSSEGTKVDGVFTDPPFGIGYQSSNKRRLLNDDVPLLRSVEQMANVMHTDTALVMCTRWDVGHVWSESMVGAGLKLKTPIVWDKLTPGTGDCIGDLAGDWEMALVAHKGRCKLRPWIDSEGIIQSLRIRGGDMTVEDKRGQLIKRDGSVWRFAKEHPEVYQLHPTPKPPKLFERMLHNFTDVGDIVLDPFGGVATSGLAAIATGRRYIGIELDPHYYGEGIKRLRALARATGLADE